MGRAALLVLAALGGCASAPPAEQGGTALKRWGARAEISAEYKRTENPGGEETEQLLLREIVALDFEGRVYDKRLLQFRLGGELALTQAELVGDNAGFQNTLLPGYDATLSFLAEHPYPLTLFARRQENRSILPTTTFSSLIETLTEEYGAEVGLRLKPFAGSFGFRRTEISSESQLVSRREERDTYSAFLRHQPDQPVTTLLSYRFEDILEQPTGQDYTSGYFNLTNTIEVGSRAEPTALIRTQLNHWDRTGSVNFTSLDWSEALTIWLKPNLESQTRYDFIQYRAETFSKRRALTQSLTHKLYDSLVTTLEGRVSDESVDEFEVLRRGAGLSLAYTKKTRLGQLRLGYGFDFERQQNSPGSGSIQVTDESQTLSTGALTLLDNLDVFLATVLVTNSAGTLVYTEGIDYELIARGRRTEIGRIPTGAIPDGAAVSIDYQYATPSAGSVDTRRQHAGVGLRPAQGIDLYARYDRVRQEQVRGTRSAPLDQLDAWVLGADFSRSGLRLLAEYEDYDSTSAPYRLTRAEIGYTRALGQNWQVGLGFTDLRTFFDEGGDLRVDTFQGLVRAAFRPTWTLLFEPSYRIERGRDSERDLASLRLDLAYSLGELHFHVEVLHEWGSQEGRGIGETFLSFRVEKRW